MHGPDMSLPQKEQDTIVTEKPIPVMIGEKYEHVMAKAVIVQKAAIRSPTTNQILTPASVVITIEGTGDSAEKLGWFVAANEVVALSFVGVPVRPRQEGD